jgi:Tfp pilus assembly protein PilN
LLFPRRSSLPSRINLVPKSERARTTTNVGALALIAGAVLVVFGLGLSYYLLTTSRSSLKEDLGFLQEQRTALEAQVLALNDYKILETKRIDLESVVQGAYAGRTLVSDFLSDLSRVVPENVWFTNVSLSVADPVAGLTDGQGAAGVDTASSFSVQGNTYGFANVSLLLVRLELVEGLRKITLGNAGDPIGTVDPAKKDVKGFSISALIVNTQPKDAPLPVSKVEVEVL